MNSQGKKLKNQFKDFCTGQIHRYKVQPTKMDVYTALYITADEKHMMDIVNRRVSLTVKILCLLTSQKDLNKFRQLR